MAKRPHYAGTYQQRAARVRAAANADPFTRCWRCGRTKAQHKRKWTAGHVNAGDARPDALLLPECEACNYSHGARMLNTGTVPASRLW